MITFDEIVDRSQILAEDLQERLRIRFDEDATAQLALLQLMPLDQDKIPLALSDSVLALNPRHGLANLVRSYLSLHYLMDDDDQRLVADRLRTLIGLGIEVGAACLQLDEIERALNPIAGYPATDTLIQLSIKTEPTWTLNHVRLARGFRDAGRPDEARREFDVAISNLILDEGSLDPLEWSFAACFTGQLWPLDGMEEERAAL